MNLDAVAVVPLVVVLAWLVLLLWGLARGYAAGRVVVRGSDRRRDGHLLLVVGAASYRLTDNVRPGSIVLLHPWAEGNADAPGATPGILAAFQVRGYRFVTVSELLALG